MLKEAQAKFKSLKSNKNMNSHFNDFKMSGN